MNIENIEWIYVTKENEVYKLGIGQNLAVEKFVVEQSIIGYGIEGYLLASFFAILNKKDVAFCRRNKKCHGTGKTIDGVVTPHKYCLFCLEQDIEEAICQLQDSINIDKIITFKLKNKFENSWLNSILGISTGECLVDDKINMREYVDTLCDRHYVLSSGKVKDYYYETLPAANTYKLIQNVVYKNYIELSKGDAYVGIGYGGVYFAIYASMIYKRDLYIFYDEYDEQTYSLPDTQVIFFDDFVSTSKSIKNAVYKLGVHMYKSIILYAKKNIDLDGDIYQICEYL